MKDQRRIIIKNEKLIKIRNNLRKIIIQSIYDEFAILGNFSSLYGGFEELTPEETVDVYHLEGKRHKLLWGLSKSICVCPICTNDETDMIYIKSHDIWYCVNCQEKNLIFNIPHESRDDKINHNYSDISLKQKK